MNVIARTSIEIPLNETMLGKGIIDAPLRLREALAAYNVHSYATQEIGTTISVPLTLVSNGERKQQEARFTRPKTHGGRYSRIWITGLSGAAKTGDVLAIELGGEAPISAVVSTVASPEVSLPRGVQIGPEVTARDFSGYGGGRRLTELLKEHVLIVMSGMIECQAGHYIGATVAEISGAADLGFDTLDESRAVVKATLSSLVRLGLVDVRKRGISYHYTLVNSR